METSVIRLSSSLLAAAFAYLALTGFPPPGTGSKPQSEVTRRMMASARDNFDRGEYVLALPPAQELHRLFPENHIYIEQLANIYNRLRRYPEEAEMWELYLQYSPVPIEGCPQVGIAWRNQALADKAINALKRCLALEPNNPDVIYQLGYTSEHSSPNAAAELYHQGLRHQPDNADLILGLARIGLNQGRSAQAASEAMRVLQKVPDNTDALLLAGLALTRLDRLDEAQRLLERGALLSPRYADLQVALAAIFERRRDFPAAILHYEKALQLDPENRDASFRLEQLRLRTPSRGPR